jgi:hypothetical protein
MRFQPKDDETIKREQNFGDPFPKGDYDVAVREAADEKSKKTGNDQIHLTIVIRNDNDERRTAHDYLLEAMSKKLKSFCAAAGLMDEYESGELSAAHCAGQELRAKVDVEPAKDGYDAKNVIREYLPRVSAGRTQPAAQPTQPQATGANGSDTARVAAFKQFLVKWNAHLNTHPDDAKNRDEAWLGALAAFYPQKKQEDLTSADWVRIMQAFKVWDPIKGFPGTGASQGPPFAESESHFQDADIPFAWSGRLSPPI